METNFLSRVKRHSFSFKEQLIEPDCFHPLAPREIHRKLHLVQLTHLDFKSRVCPGEIVVHTLALDLIEQFFKTAFEIGFPIHSVIPLHHKPFNSEEYWSDDISMELNNSSGFNYRKKTHKDELSPHALGLAFDINPVLNPFLVSHRVYPQNGSYDPEQPGTLTQGHPLVELCLNQGWKWGGHFVECKDYHHFEKESYLGYTPES